MSAASAGSRRDTSIQITHREDATEDLGGNEAPVPSDGAIPANGVGATWVTRGEHSSGDIARVFRLAVSAGHRSMLLRHLAGIAHPRYRASLPPRSSCVLAVG